MAVKLTQFKVLQDQILALKEGGRDLLKLTESYHCQIFGVDGLVESSKNNDHPISKMRDLLDKIKNEMKAKEKKVLCICKRCNKQYDKDRLIFSLGDFSAVVESGHCSAFCYADHLLAKGNRFLYTQLGKEINKI